MYMTTSVIPVSPLIGEDGFGCTAHLFNFITYNCASGDWLTSRPKGCSQPRELWFFDILMYIHVHVYVDHYLFIPQLFQCLSRQGLQ